MLTDIMLVLHILSSIAAVGASTTYFFWLGRAADDAGSRLFTLQTIQTLERRYVIPAYVLVGVTGVVLIYTVYERFNVPWAELALLVYVVLMGLVGFHSRTVKQQIVLATEGETDSTAYVGAQSRGSIIRYLQLVAVLVLVYLMIFKPALWG